jgi:DHA2 family multidrug resistance protein
MVERAALAMSANEAWALLAAFALIGLLLVPFAGKFVPSYATEANVGG